MNEAALFNYGDEKIPFQIVNRKSSLLKILIKVHPDCRVEVMAPSSASDEEIIRAVAKRGRWIYQQLRDFREHQKYVLPRQYISGESHYYLGKQYVLKVAELSEGEEYVKLTRGKLEVYLRKKSAKRVDELLMIWYREKAKEVFAKRLDVMLEKALWVKSRPPLRTHIMKTQWGSCSPSGRLTLNPHLVKAPRECIDYVILHELCHIAEHNHSKKFYRLMERVMPGWESIKVKLDNFCIGGF